MLIHMQKHITTHTHTLNYIHDDVTSPVEFIRVTGGSSPGSD